jgi:pilus assembly protein CpaC
MRPSSVIKRLLPLLGVVLIGAPLALASAAQAQQKTPEIISASDGPIGLELGQGKLIRVDQDISTVFAAEPNIADVQVTSPRLIYVMAKGVGTTTLFAVDGDETVMAGIPLTVTPSLLDVRMAASSLRDTIARMYPELTIDVSVLGQKLILSGEVTSPVETENLRLLAEAAFVHVGGGRASGGTGTMGSENVIMRLTVPGSNQVNLRVRFAEVSRAVTKSLGIDWTSAISDAGLTYGLSAVSPFSAASAVASTIGFSRGGYSVDAALTALEDEGMISILAEPNLTAVSGESASFLAGGEFPILYPDGQGATVVTFKQFGVSLEFTPTIIGPERINLKVKPEVSQIDTANSITLNNFVIPALTTRRVETTVELASGQSFAVAGLLQNNLSQSVNRVPGLGKVPVLGRLFTSDEFQREETELVVIITPYLVKPQGGKLSTPVDGLMPGTDRDRYLNHFPGGPDPEPGARFSAGSTPTLNGPLGFIF